MKMITPRSVVALFGVAFVLLVTPVGSAAEVEVLLEGNDQMKYNLTEFKVKAGDTVKLTLKNVGKLPKAAMGHNFVLLKAGTDWKQFATDAMNAAKDEYIPPARAGEVLATTKLLGPGESETVTFTAPKEPGSYDFICSFPAHALVGMRGVMIVE